MWTLLYCIILLMCVTRSCFAVLVDGRNMSMEDAIIRASVNGSNTKIFELMQDANSVLVELDMQFTIKDYAEIRRGMSMPTSGTRRKRKAIRALSYRWTNQQVPYEISTEFSASDRQLISAAMDDYHKYTCIRFVPATSAHVNKVRFVNGGGCSSYVGMIGGTQLLTLAPGCRYKGIIIHEMGHAVGFQHEQTRPDRDSYVSIQLANIQRGMEYNFVKYDTAQVNTYEVPYDYTSVMHYSQYAFSVTGQPTIIATDSRYQTEMGNREGFSFNDIRLANLMYECAAKSGCQQRQCPAGGFQGKDCKCYCQSGTLSSPLIECTTTPGIVSTTTGTTASTRPTATTATGCQDMSQNCPAWAQSGYCTGQYSVYMVSNCKRSCNLCAATTTKAPIPTAAPTCKDDSTYCIAWAKAGECSRNPLYMNSYCKKSCNVCATATPPPGVTTTKAPITTAAPTCKDESTFCIAWAKAGECSRNPLYMNNYCKKSCNVCATATPPPACNDLNTLCSSWKPYCIHETYREFLRLNCRRTCQYC